MRKVLFLFAILVTIAGFSYAEDSVDTARAATRNMPTSRTKSAQTVDRSNANTDTKTTDFSRATVARRVAGSIQTNRDSATRQQVVSRAAVTNKIIQSKIPGATTAIVVDRRPVATSSRAAVTRSIFLQPATRTSLTAARSASRSRAAATQKIVGAAISDKYAKCRTAFFACMDEFCSNKDATLKRCACSSRLHDFDAEKQALNQAQTKLSDFQKRLVSVNMDKEDAQAISKSTDGENASNKTDTSSSQQALNDIVKKINSSTTDNEQSQSATALDLSTTSSFTSTDMFDSVDSMMGSDTTTKEGEALYNAALPSCEDISKETCDTDDISIVESAYQMAVEQDCNTLSKNYELMKSNALSKASDGSALLDMSRLTNYQDRNSDDILACTKKMLDSLSTDSVCGTDLGKCLDWSGKYIDPSTGSAILSTDLANLANILVRPNEGTKWVDVTANANMVKFLESKKTYVEPSMQKCETISEAVWNTFMEDALAKIKVEQEKRLEDMRQNCTILVGQCKQSENTSIQDFDSRALSVFGVAADATINKMCDDVQSACSALMKNYLAKDETPNSSGQSQTGTDWEEGMNDVDLQKTYSTILQNCKLVGQECVKLQCQTNEAQFGLCTEQTAAQRRNVLNVVLKSNYCYNQVKDCVGSTQIENLSKIEEKNPNDFGGHTYKVDDSSSIGSTISAQSKITQNIWGRCNKDSMTDQTNYIIHGDSVLSWFGDSTFNGDGSCYTGKCVAGFYYLLGQWIDGSWAELCSQYGASDYEACSDDSSAISQGGVVDGKPETSIITVYQLSDDNSEKLPNELIYNNPSDTHNYFTNCCFTGLKDDFGNCCEVASDRITPTTANSWIKPTRTTSDIKVCDPTKQCCFDTTDSLHTNVKQEHNPNYTEPPFTYCKPNNSANWNYVATNNGTHLFCLGTLNDSNYGIDDTASEKTCDGTFVSVDTKGTYRSRLVLGADQNGTEKYLNYIYDNLSNNEDDIDQHHLLYAYLPANGNYMNFQGIVQTVAASGYYNISLDAATIHPKNDAIGYHRVAYCENGFKISLSSQAYECCTVADNCKIYKIVQ